MTNIIQRSLFVLAQLLISLTVFSSNFNERACEINWTKLEKVVSYDGSTCLYTLSFEYNGVAVEFGDFICRSGGEHTITPDLYHMHYDNTDEFGSYCPARIYITYDFYCCADPDESFTYSFHIDLEGCHENSLEIEAIVPVIPGFAPCQKSFRAVMENCEVEDLCLSWNLDGASWFSKMDNADEINLEFECEESGPHTLSVRLENCGFPSVVLEEASIEFEVNCACCLGSPADYTLESSRIYGCNYEFELKAPLFQVFGFDIDDWCVDWYVNGEFRKSGGTKFAANLGSSDLSIDPNWYKAICAHMYCCNYPAEVEVFCDTIFCSGASGYMRSALDLQPDNSCSEIYLNSTKSEGEIASGRTTRKILYYQIIDAQGEITYEEKFEKPIPWGDIKLPVLEPGLYEMKDGKGIIFKKLRVE
jgi:hypothetical protein